MLLNEREYLAVLQEALEHINKAKYQASISANMALIHRNRRINMQPFKCSHIYKSGRKMKWIGNWEVLSVEPDSHELLIKGRGSEFHAILGYYSYGNYLCIPSIDIGCALGYWSDVFWNTERLSHVMNATDAVTIATALDSYGRS